MRACYEMRMSLFSRIAALILPLLLALHGPVALASEAQEAHPPLWKVSDADTVIYLFGTIHALPQDVDWYRGQVAVALGSALELVTEIGEPPADGLQKAILNRALLPRGKSLRGMLSAEERARYEAALAGLKVPPEQLDMFKPWFAAVNLVMARLNQVGITGQQGVEPFIAERARRLGQKSVALETVDYQFAQFDSLPQEVQKRYLMEAVDNLDQVESELGRIIAAWKAGNAEELAALVNDNTDDPEFAAVLLYPRNKAWADWIKARLDRPGIVFVAVGAGHLAGMGSVQEELGARGVASLRVQ